VEGCCEHGNEHLGSIKGGEYPDQLSDVGFSRRTLLHGVSYVSYKEEAHRLIYVSGW
jgi:hypothetical protein